LLLLFYITYRYDLLFCFIISVFLRRSLRHEWYIWLHFYFLFIDGNTIHERTNELVGNRQVEMSFEWPGDFNDGIAKTLMYTILYYSR